MESGFSGLEMVDSIIRVEFLLLTSKTVEHSRHLPAIA